AGAQILDHLVGLENVGANLVAPADIGLAGRLGVGRFLALLQLHLIEPRLQHVHGGGAVLVLAALLLAGHDATGGQMGDADRRIRGVHGLPARARGAVGVDLEVAFANLDVDGIVDHGIDPDAGKAGVAAGGRIIGADAHQPVHAALGLHPAIGIVALDQDGGRLDAGLLAIVQFDGFDLHLPALGPAGVHAQQHAGPILAFGAAGARMDFDIAVIAVDFAREQGFDLGAARRLPEFGQGLFGFAHDLLVALGLAEPDQFDIVANAGVQRAHHGDGGVEIVPLAHDGAGVFRIVPEFGGFGLRVQRVE